MSVYRLLWIAIAGLLLGTLGFLWDRSWHARHPDNELTGVSEVVEAHWLMIFGVLIIFLVSARAVRAVRQPRVLVGSVWVAFLGSIAMVVGFAWDSVRHIQGTESAIAHALIYVGLLVVIIAIPAALLLGRGQRYR